MKYCNNKKRQTSELYVHIYTQEYRNRIPRWFLHSYNSIFDFDYHESMRSVNNNVSCPYIIYNKIKLSNDEIY